ncbi:MAG: efflux transporter outer membrane subunit [Woeseiaceae bacterium]
MNANPTSFRRIVSFGSMAAALMLVGCAVGPDFEKPEVPTPEGWLETAEAQLPTDASDQRDWWRSFNDPALEALIQRAFEENQALEIAGLRVYEAHAQLGFARGTLYPQIMSARLSADDIELSENAEPVSYLPPLTQAGVDTEYQTYRLGFDAAWEADFWGRFRRIVETADSSLAARVAAYDAALVSLTGEVASTYILLRTLEERLAVARSNLKVQQRSQEISGVRFRNELTSELDVVQATVQVKNTEALIPRLEAALREVENALSLLLGASPGEVRKIIGDAADIPVAPTSVAIGMPTDLLRRRPDIRQAEYVAAMQSALIGVTKAELYPAFSLGGTIGFAAEDFGDLTDSGSSTRILGAGFRWNIFNFGRVKNRVRANDARLQQALTGYELAVLNALREVENAQSAFLRSQEEVTSLAAATESARRAVDLANIQYRDGISDFERVLLAQEALLFQEGLQTDARGRVARNLVAIYRALGGGWQIREGQDFISTESKDAMRERTNWGDLLDANQ